MNKKYKKVNPNFYFIKNSTNFLTSTVGKIILTFTLIFSVSSFAQDLDLIQGKALFNANCAACHKINKRAIGPALKGVSEKYDKEWLYSWIKKGSAMIKAGDAQAVAIYEEYNKSIMNNFPQFSNLPRAKKTYSVKAALVRRETRTTSARARKKRDY